MKMNEWFLNKLVDLHLWKKEKNPACFFSFFLCLIQILHILFFVFDWNNMEIRDATESEGSKTLFLCYVSDTVKETIDRWDSCLTLLWNDVKRSRKNTININICKTRLLCCLPLSSLNTYISHPPAYHLECSTLFSLLIMCWIAFCMIAPSLEQIPFQTLL